MSHGKISFGVDRLMRIVRCWMGVKFWVSTSSAWCPCLKNNERGMPSTGCGDHLSRKGWGIVGQIGMYLIEGIRVDPY